MFLGGLVVVDMSSEFPGSFDDSLLVPFEFPGSFDDLMSRDSDLVGLDDGEIGKLVFGLDMFLRSMILIPLP